MATTRFPYLLKIVKPWYPTIHRKPCNVQTGFRRSFKETRSYMKTTKPSWETLSQKGYTRKVSKSVENGIPTKRERSELFYIAWPHLMNYWWTTCYTRPHLANLLVGVLTCFYQRWKFQTVTPHFIAISGGKMGTWLKNCKNIRWLYICLGKYLPQSV